jgi:hypothetical protein
VAGCFTSKAPEGYSCAGNPCDDGIACNGLELCDPHGGCYRGAKMDCDDADPCTVDGCADGACTHTPRDLDGDGHADRCAGGDDCEPLDATVFPGAPETCNERDDDCDLEVDEGLVYEVGAEIPIDLPVLPSGHFPRPLAVLADRTILAVSSPTELAGLRDGTVRLVERREQPLAGWSDVPGGFANVLVDGHTAWFIEVEGDLLVSSSGQRRNAFDTIAFRGFTSDYDLLWMTSDEWDIGPPVGQRSWPAALSADWFGWHPRVAWVGASRGHAEIRIAGNRTDFAAVRAVGAVEATSLLWRPDGYVLLWVERVPGPARRLQVLRQLPDHRTLRAVVTEADEILVDACALPDDETAVAWSAIDDGSPTRELVVLDRSLQVAESLLTLDAEAQVRCAGRSIWVAEAQRLRRVHRSGVVDVDLAFDELIRLVPSATSVWWRTGDDDPAGRSSAWELSCAP